MRSAAAAERQRLAREQRRVDQRVAALRRQLAELEAVQAQLVERNAVLDLLAYGDAAERNSTDASEPNETTRGTEAARPADERPHEADVQVLRGARIREVAVRLLADSPRAEEAMHYREWFRLLDDAGFLVAGKDPEASFLTQLGRSPVVRRSTQAGVYALDFDFIPQARERLHELRRQLRSTHDLPEAASAQELDEAREMRFALRDQIDTLERQLKEALETLGERAKARNA